MSPHPASSCLRTLATFFQQLADGLDGGTLPPEAAGDRLRAVMDELDTLEQELDSGVPCNPDALLTRISAQAAQYARFRAQDEASGLG